MKKNHYLLFVAYTSTLKHNVQVKRESPRSGSAISTLSGQLLTGINGFMPIETCTRCRGTKEVIKLGMMKAPCDDCDASGYKVIKTDKVDKPEEKAIIKKKAKPKFPLLKDDKANGEDPEPQAA
jgi:hypothetical protein